MSAEGSLCIHQYTRDMVCRRRIMRTRPSRAPLIWTKYFAEGYVGWQIKTVLAPQSEATRTEPIADAQDEVVSASCRDFSMYSSCISSGGLSSPMRGQRCSISGGINFRGS